MEEKTRHAPVEVDSSERLTRPPFPIDDLKRGDYLSEEDIKARMPEARGLYGQSYAFFLLQLRQVLMRELLLRGNGDTERIWVKSENNGLRLLTNAEQSDWVAKQANAHRRGLRKDLVYLIGVNTIKLTEEEQRVHEHRLVVESRYMQAQDRIGKELEQNRLQTRLQELLPNKTKEE